MRVVGASHCNRVLVVLKTVGRFVLDRIASGLLLQTGFEAAALNHEALDDAVKDRAVVKTRANVLKEVLAGLRSCGFIEFDVKDALIGRKAKHCDSTFL